MIDCYQGKGVGKRMYFLNVMQLEEYKDSSYIFEVLSLTFGSI